MPEQTCRVCDQHLPPRRERRGRSPLYCSPACRQVAYRTRHGPPPDEAVRQQVADVSRLVRRLRLDPADALYQDVAELSAAVSKLRRLARARRNG